MSTIVTRSGKGSPLTHVEVDANFTNLNTDKYQEGSAIGATTPAAGTFTTLTGGGGSANYFQTQGAATTKAVEAKALGSDSNIAFVIDSKGTGAIDLAAGSSGVNISNGGTVTAITKTAGGSGYTTTPTVAISAPTTAGGVQATASTTYNLFGTSIVSGGTGYTVGDTLTFVGGTFTDVLQYTVTAVSGGVITGVSVLTPSFGIYSALPPSTPATVTGGTGTGATFNLTWTLRTIAVNAAGSGYVEQPTVTFSGGGGSGATAYATVGSGTTVKSIGSTMSFYTPEGEAFRTQGTSGQTSAAYWVAFGHSTTPILRGNTGSPAIQTVGTGSLLLQTNSGFTQAAVSHTASAVNYVQVTGAATGGRVTISSQGSDANVPVVIGTKGSGSLNVRTNDSVTTQFAVTSTSSAVNYINVTGAVTGFGPVVSALGSDTNIPLVLQPKGTGALQAQQTDSTATGGNARGANAVDWQTNRNTAGQVASNSYTVIGGGSANLCSGFNASIVGGSSNISSNNYSFVGCGLSNTASSPYATTTGGYSNTATGFLNFIGGGYSNAGTSGSSVTTQSGTMNGTTAVTLSGSNANIKVGQLITGTSIATFPFTYVAAISGTSLTLSQAASGSSTSTLSFFTPHGVVVGGGNNQATGSYSFIGGGGDAGTAGNRNVASGDWSFVGGGFKNTASGLESNVVGGDNNTASGTRSFIGAGQANTASATGSAVFGGRDNNSNAAFGTVVSGVRGNSRSINTYCVFASSAPISETSGGTQAGLLIIARQTTDATPTVLAADGAAAGTTNQVILPNNSAYYFKGTVVAGVTGGGNTKGWTIEGVIKRGANAASTTVVGVTVASMYADAGAVTWTIGATADTTNGGLAITFTGQAGTTIRTVAQITTTEMTF